MVPCPHALVVPHTRIRNLLIMLSLAAELFRLLCVHHEERRKPFFVAK